MPDYVFIIGAAKCGTTALADALDRHPQVCLSHPKEPDFFTDRTFSKGFEWYASRFARDPAARVWLDASVSYTAGWEGSSAPTARRIQEFAPSASLIYVVRDPVARCWSAYWHAVRNQKEKRPFEQVMRDHQSDYITASQYAARLHDFLLYFPAEQMRILTQAEIRNDQNRVVSDILAACDLDASQIDEMVSERAVNNSYQLNGIGNLLFSVVPLPLIKRAAFWVNRNAPEFVTTTLRSMMSKEVPDIKPEYARYLVEVLGDDAAQFRTMTGVEVRTGEWWQAAESGARETCADTRESNAS